VNEDQVLDQLEADGAVASEDGAQLLGDLCAAFTRYVAFPSEESADAATLFTAATHAQPVWENATRLVIKSPLKQCGKTRLQEVAAELCHRPLRTTNISVAALVRSIDEDDPPTVIMDEADSVFSKRRGERSEGAEDLRGILNAGHSRGWPYVRWDAAARKSEQCATFAMAIIGGIGDFPDTVEDRAVVLRMRRRAPGEHVAEFRRRHAIPPLHRLRDRLHAWVRQNLVALEQLESDLPVRDRAADVWEPLIRIADVAGGDWPQRARAACMALTSDTDPDDATAGERLLADLRGVFNGSDKLASTAILERLYDIEEAPWSDWYGKELSPRGLAKLLKPYGIKSKNVRVGADIPKGYERAQFEDAWERYLGSSALQGLQRHKVTETADERRSGFVAERDSDNRYTPDQPKRNDVANVADVAANRLDACAFDGCTVAAERSTYWGSVYCEPHFKEIAARHDRDKTWPEKPAHLEVVK
jgi:hypothetical protein